MYHDGPDTIYIQHLLIDSGLFMKFIDVDVVDVDVVDAVVTFYLTLETKEIQLREDSQIYRGKG